MARSASDNSEGLTFTGADIWVPRGPISRNEQFGIPTGYYSAVVRQTTGTVSNGGGRPAPARWARTTGTTPCALPRRLPPTHILNSTASDFQTHRTLRAGPAPRMLPWPPSRDLAAPAPAGSLDSTRATQTPRCGGSRAGVVCHRRAPRFDRRRAAAERCSRSNLAAAISQPRVCRRSSL